MSLKSSTSQHGSIKDLRAPRDRRTTIIGTKQKQRKGAVLQVRLDEEELQTLSRPENATAGCKGRSFSAPSVSPVGSALIEKLQDAQPVSSKLRKSYPQALLEISSTRSSQRISAEDWGKRGFLPPVNEHVEFKFEEDPKSTIPLAEIRGISKSGEDSYPWPSSPVENLTGLKDSFADDNSDLHRNVLSSEELQDSDEERDDPSNMSAFWLFASLVGSAVVFSSRFGGSH